jgi:hypothetical protein
MIPNIQGAAFSQLCLDGGVIGETGKEPSEQLLKGGNANE